MSNESETDMPSTDVQTPSDDTEDTSSDALRQFIEGSQDAICFRDKDRRLFLWNHVFADSVKTLFGIDLCPGMRAEDYVPQQVLAGFHAHRAAMLSALTGEAQRAEFEFPSPGGEARYYEITWSPARRDGEIYAVAEVTRDVTERKLAEGRLREAEQRYRTVADFTYDWTYWEGPEGELRYVSPSCERITGYTVEEFLNDPHLISGIVLANDQAIWEGHRHESHQEETLRFVQFRIQRKDGQVRWIEHACLPVSGEQGEFSGLRASNRDITERKEAEQALAVSEDNLNRAQQVASIGSWYLDIERDELTWSDEAYRLFGVPRGTPLTYETFLERVHPEDRVRVDSAWKAALNREPYDVEHRIVVENEVRWVRERADLEFDEEGNPVHGIGTAQDITEHRRDEEEIRRLREELTGVSRVATMGELTASIAHELNQPLTAILTNAQAAQRLLSSEKPQLQLVREALADIASDDRRAGEVIRRLRTLLEQHETELAPLELTEVIREVIGLVRGEIAVKGITLNLDLPALLPHVEGDRVQLQQLVLNLTLNAVESMSELESTDRVLTLAASIDKTNAVKISVRDSGTGLDEDAMMDIFEPFYTTKSKGMGMGLAISRSIIEAHDGRLWAENSPDKGATFHFTIPIPHRGGHE